MAEDADVSGGVIGLMMKRSKNHLLKSRADLQGILSPYTLKKDEFLLIVLAIVRALS